MSLSNKRLNLIICSLVMILSVLSCVNSLLVNPISSSKYNKEMVTENHIPHSAFRYHSSFFNVNISNGNYNLSLKNSSISFSLSNLTVIFEEGWGNSIMNLSTTFYGLDSIWQYIDIEIVVYNKDGSGKAYPLIPVLVSNESHQVIGVFSNEIQYNQAEFYQLSWNSYYRYYLFYCEISTTDITTPIPEKIYITSYAYFIYLPILLINILYILITAIPYVRLELKHPHEKNYDIERRFDLACNSCPCVVYVFFLIDTLGLGKALSFYSFTSQNLDIANFLFIGIFLFFLGIYYKKIKKTINTS